MRKKKNEEIRRLVSAAAGMCDLSSLASVKRKLAEAVRELDELADERSRAAAEPQKPRLKIDNPAAAMMALEDEIRKEKEKLTPKELFRD